MKFSGIQKTSLIDFPNRVASVLFTSGCNLRCPFCHNWRLLDPKPPFLQEETVLEILESRRNYVDAVVITGGEPTIHDGLPDFLRKLKDRKFAVKLDTNGFRPSVLKESLPYLDYVALDVKTRLEKYAWLGAKSVTPLLCAIRTLKAGKVEHEFRTTVVPGLVDKEDIVAICEILKGARTFALQQFSSEETMDSGLAMIRPYSVERIAEFGSTVRDIENVIIRA